MLSINGTDIQLTRGNTAVLDIVPYIDKPENPVMLNEGDKVLFTVQTSLDVQQLQKVLTYSDQSEDGSLQLVIEPQDTIGLADGAYTYDVVIIFADGGAYTFIPKSEFQVLKAIGTYQDLEVSP